MELKDFMAGLLKEARLTSNGLADKMENRSIQSQVHRIVEGQTRNPRRVTMLPIAEFFGVPIGAFFDPDEADRIARLRNWPAAGSERTGEVDAPEWPLAIAAPTPIRDRLRTLTVYDLSLAIAVAFEGQDQSVRRAAASLLGDLALQPENAGLTAGRIARLLGEPGNGLQPGSTTSLPNAK